MAARAFHVDLDDPDHGWQGIDIRAAGEVLTESFSYIYPSLDDLCGALDDALRGFASRPVVFLLEPAELVLEIRPAEPPASTVRVLLHADGRHARAPEELLTYTGPTREIVRAFWLALRRLETRFPPEEYARRYRREFPSRAVAALSARLKAG
jgi:hypothetical protein